MKIHDQSILTIYEALLWLFKLCFLTTMFHNKSGIGSHAQLFLVDSAVIEYTTRSCYASLQSVADSLCHVLAALKP